MVTSAQVNRTRCILLGAPIYREPPVQTVAVRGRGGAEQAGAEIAGGTVLSGPAPGSPGGGADHPATAGGPGISPGRAMPWKKTRTAGLTDAAMVS
jgi:hypothetical protein